MKANVFHQAWKGHHVVCREILGMLSDNARRMGPLREKLQWVELWMHRRHLSEKLGRRVRAYYTEIWSNHKGKTLNPKVLKSSGKKTLHYAQQVLQGGQRLTVVCCTTTRQSLVCPGLELLPPPPPPHSASTILQYQQLA